jgi:hypothetical protein
VRQAGRIIFGAVLGIQALLVVFIGPSFTAGAITGEKERQTYGLLRTTLLSASAFVTGKLVSALSYVLLLILAAVPLQSIAFLLGGVSPLEFVVGGALLLVSAVTFALVGLFFSSLLRSTLAASVATFTSGRGRRPGAPPGLDRFCQGRPEPAAGSRPHLPGAGAGVDQFARHPGRQRDFSHRAEHRRRLHGSHLRHHRLHLFALVRLSRPLHAAGPLFILAHGAARAPHSENVVPRISEFAPPVVD